MKPNGSPNLPLHDCLACAEQDMGVGGGGGVGDGGRGGGISCAQTEAMIWGKGMNIGSDLNHSWVFLIGV